MFYKERAVFPCLDADGCYTGCIGKECCPASRCWTGERLGTKERPTLHEAGAARLSQLEGRWVYKTTPCPDCAEAVDVEEVHRARNGRLVERWVVCLQGLWVAPATIHQLVHRRVPRLEAGPCPRFRPREEPRPEVVAKRAADAIRQRRCTARRRAG